MAKKETETRDSIVPFDVKRIPWKLIFSLLAVLGIGGGGSYVFVTENQVDEKLDTQKTEITKSIDDFKSLENDRHVKIDETFKEVKETVNDIQTVQHSQVARDEARRITESIKDRRERETSYDRLIGMNMRRLKEKKDPCFNVDCTN